MTLVMMLVCIGVARADYPASKISYPYGGVQTNASALNMVRISQNGFGAQPEIRTTASANATFTNLESDEVVEATSIEIVKGGTENYPVYNVEVHFPNLPENGDWEFSLAAGSLETATGDLNPAYTATWTLNDPALDVDRIEPVELTPAAGSAVMGVGKEMGTWTIRFADDLQKQIGYAKVVLTDADPGHRYDDATFYKQTNAYHEVGTTDPISIYWGGATSKMYQGYEYKLTVECHTQEYDGTVLGVFECVYNGGSGAYVYAPETLTLITPVPQNYDKSNPEGYIFEDKGNNVIRMVFSGPVDCVEADTKVNIGQGVTAEFSSIASNAEKTEWALTLPAGLITPPEVGFYASFTGSNGARVKGNNGREDYSCFSYQYFVEVGTPELVADPAPDTDVELDEISRIVLTNDQNMEMNLAYSADKVQIQNLQGSVIYTFDTSKIEVADDNKSITLVADPAFTTPGPCVVIIPKGFFSISDEESGFSVFSKATTLSYNIKETEAPVEYTLYLESASIESGSVVKELSLVDLYFAEDSMVGFADQNNFPVYFTSETGAKAADEPVAYATMEWDLDVFNMMHVYMTSDTNGTKTTLTENGTYSFVIPAGAIIDENSGNMNPELSFSYTVSKNVGIDAVGIDKASTFDVYNVNGVRVLRDADASDLNGLEKGIYIVNGRKIVVK